MNRLGNSLAIVVAIVCSIWRANSSRHLGVFIHKPERGGFFLRSISFLCGRVGEEVLFSAISASSGRVG